MSERIYGKIYKAKQLEAVDYNQDGGLVNFHCDISNNVILIKGPVLHKRGCRLGHSSFFVEDVIKDGIFSTCACKKPYVRDSNNLNLNDFYHRNNYLFDSALEHSN